MGLPGEVLLCEVGPRDGFQYESAEIPTALKISIIRDLIGAGLRRLQIVSFVHPGIVPQMADAESVAEAILPLQEHATLAGLALNLRGVERAIAAGFRHVDLSIATHDRHSRENANMSVDEAVREAERMVSRAQAAGLHVQLGLQTVFGYGSPGDTPLDHVATLCGRFCDWGVDEISLADTTGMANPNLIESYVHGVQDRIGELPLVLHLHDTRGLGLANVFAGLQCGVDRFDTSLGGMGGCPFIPGATGNIATEDTAFLMRGLGIETGVAIEPIAGCTRRLAKHLGKNFPGKLYRLGDD